MKVSTTTTTALFSSHEILIHPGRVDRYTENILGIWLHKKRVKCTKLIV